jgi:imidazolonepropionase-like amidohydrolase
MRDSFVSGVCRLACANRALPVAAALALAVPIATAHAQVVAIVNGTVYPASGPEIPNGTVVIRDGKIAAVGAGISVPDGATRIDATGRWVTPGFVDAASSLGLVEVGGVADTRDISARGHDGIAAAFNAIDGLNANSPMIPLARAGGVTSAVVMPQGGLVAGQASWFDLASGTARSLVVRSSIGMAADIGDPRMAGTTARGETVARLRALLDDALAYDRQSSAYNANRLRPLTASRPDLAALGPVLHRQELLVLHADRADDIENALQLARDYRLRIAIAGASEAWKVATDVAAARVPVLTGALHNVPSTFSTLDVRPDNAALLRRAGVSVVLIGNSSEDQGPFNVRNIRQDAGAAVANGMPWDQALAAITTVPATVFGLQDRVGALRPGYEANVVVWSGDPFELSTRAEHVFVRGVEHTEPTREDLLTQRYRTLPPR